MHSTPSRQAAKTGRGRRRAGGTSLATLDQFIERASAIRGDLEALQCWLERPAPWVDVTKIIGNGNSGNYEGYVDIAELER